MIPKHFHWVWIGTALPAWAEANMRLFRELNPEFASTLHGEEVLLPEFADAYAAIQGEHLYARKSDLLRLSALVRHGGWYFDCDFLPIRPLRELYGHYSDFPKRCFVTHGAFLGNRPWIANGIIGTESDAPFLQRLRAEAVARGQMRPLRWETFGPGLFTDLAEKHPQEVHVGLLDDFYRLQERRQSMAAYARIRAADYAREAIVRELGEPLPFALHQSQQDSLEVPNA